MIFPVLELERVIQVGDKTRLSGVKSFCANQVIDSVSISPEAGADFIDCTGFDPRDWRVDWIYSGAMRTATVTLKIVSGTDTEIVTKPIIILTAADDQLLSDDQDIEALEPKLLSYVPEGRSSFLNVHREAKFKILETLHDRRVKLANGEPITVSALTNIDQVKTWSKYLTLALIFQGMTLTPDDVFAAKAKIYQAEALSRAELAIISLDLDGDGTTDPTPESYQTVRVMSLCR